MNKTFLVASEGSSVGSFVVVVPLDFGWAGLGFGVGYSSLALLGLVVELAKTKFPFFIRKHAFLVISCKPKWGIGPTLIVCCDCDGCGCGWVATTFV